MVSVNIATSAEQPINRDASVSQYASESEGVLVGMDANGELVLANAEAASGTLQHTIGLLAAPVHDLADYSNAVAAVRSTVESQYKLLGEHKVPWIFTGVEVVNSDQDWAFTPGEPVYLGAGGGFTQTKPATAGDIVQCVGVALDDGESLMLDVDWNYTTV